MSPVKIPNADRFLGRVAAYTQGRPTYPVELISFAQEFFELSKNASIADIGAGTGILSVLFANAGYRVHAIEPNPEMREACISHPLIGIQHGIAEETGLEDNSIDLVTAAQAFHWFDPPRARNEFMRITKHPGNVLLVWNIRDEENTAFSRDYENLVKSFSHDYRNVRHRNIGDVEIKTFFSPGDFYLWKRNNAQELDWEGFWARIQSTSYMPAAESQTFDSLKKAAEELFAKHAHGGRVRFDYETKAYAGKLDS